MFSSKLVAEEKKKSGNALFIKLPKLVYTIQTRPGPCVYTKYSFGFCTKSHISLCTFQAVHDIFRIFSSKIVAPTATRLYDIIYCQLFIVSCICDFP